MYVQLTMAERLKDLRVIDKKLTLEQLAENAAMPPAGGADRLIEVCTWQI